MEGCKSSLVPIPDEKSIHKRGVALNPKKVAGANRNMYLIVHAV